MVSVTQSYLDELPPIYRDVLNGFWMFNPNARPDWGIAPQSLYSMLGDQWTLGEIQEAFQQMKEAGALDSTDNLFYRPTEMGQSIITTLQNKSGKNSRVPPFPIPA